MHGNRIWTERKFHRDPLVNSAWSRTVEVPSHDGAVHHWRVLDRPGTSDANPVILCLHGNPTWSYLWSRFLSELQPEYRVIAPDQLSMGYSDHVAPRTYKERVADIADLLRALHINQPIWIVAQDWGGAIGMGFAVAHPDRVVGMVLSNTGIAVPSGRRAPLLIKISAAFGLHRLITQYTSLFVRGTPFLPGKGITREQRQQLSKPYRKVFQRRAVADFVADVPFSAKNSSASDLQRVAESLPSLAIPVRLIWGSKDPVFNDDFAYDLLSRFKNVQLHRIADGGHLTVLESSIAPLVEQAISESIATEDRSSSVPLEPLWSRIGTARDVNRICISDAAANESVTDAEFASRVASYSSQIHNRGVTTGDRVALLVPPGINLIAAVYACWRIGAVTVIADRGLGLRGLGNAVRSARVQHVLGIRTGCLAAKLLRWAPRASMITVESLQSSDSHTMSSLSMPVPLDDSEAAVLFTSGATGPAKGVRYTHRQLCAQRDALQNTYNITRDDRFVAAFAPFALYGPALGITTGLADMDVTSPSTLTATALNDACDRIGATMVFASPAALANVLKTASGSLPALASVATVMSAGAPVPIETLRQISHLCPDAQLHTPYGMTEALPVANISLMQREHVGEGRGVCVGQGVANAEVIISSYGSQMLSSVDAGVTGEVLVRAPWLSDGYDALWYTQSLARTDGWHRTGDVGHLDTDNNLWIEGRVVHVIHTPYGDVTPVPLEIAVEAIPDVKRAAAVSVGAPGVQQVVIVVEVSAGKQGPANSALAASVRSAVAPQAVAAVFTTQKLPVDIRHNSKIDRTALGREIAQVLSGSSR